MRCLLRVVARREVDALLSALRPGSVSVLAEARAPRTDGEPVADARAARPARRPDAIVLIVLRRAALPARRADVAQVGQPGDRRGRRAHDGGPRGARRDALSGRALLLRTARALRARPDLQGPGHELRRRRSPSASSRRSRSWARSTRWRVSGSRLSVAGLATAVLLAIAFSGTTFDFVLPHTNSATIGLLCLLLELLALEPRAHRARRRRARRGRAHAARVRRRRCRRGRRLRRGDAAQRRSVRGAGRRRADRASRAGAGRRPCWGCSPRSSARTGCSWRTSGRSTSCARRASARSPTGCRSTLRALAGLGGRALVYGGLLAGLTGAAVVVAAARDGTRRALAAWPLAAALLGLLAIDAAARVTRRLRRHAHRDRGRVAAPADRHELAARARAGRRRLGGRAPGARRARSAGTLMAGSTSR